MSKQRNKKGFTLAEIMMAVAIIGILSAVAFIGVARYLRSMAQLERDGIAREIYVAAQNHLAMAEGQGYLNRDLFGNVEARAGEEKGVCVALGIRKRYRLMLAGRTFVYGGIAIRAMGHDGKLIGTFCQVEIPGAKARLPQLLVDLFHTLSFLAEHHEVQTTTHLSHIRSRHGAERRLFETQDPQHHVGVVYVPRDIHLLTLNTCGEQYPTT